jgi:hypothetical protein
VAAAGLSAVLGDDQLHRREVEDLAAFRRDHLCLVKRSATAGAGRGRVGDDLVGVRGVLEGGAGVAGLSADPPTRLLAEATSAWDFLPGRVE